MIIVLFNDVLSNCKGYAASNGRACQSEVERMKKEAFVDYFKVRCQHFPGGTEESKCLHRDLNQRRHQERHPLDDRWCLMSYNQ
jgi:hypothetical protein